MGHTERNFAICNLYRLTTPFDAVAALFGVKTKGRPNHSEIVSPTGSGLVVVKDEVRAMHWGFPRVVVSHMSGEALKPKAVTNTRSDRIGSPFWLKSFKSRRCLVPVSAWAEAAGERGRMTRTWFSLPDQSAFAIAGIWLNSPEWGHVFSMLTVEGHAQMDALNDRMPVILRQEDWRTWTDGSPTAAHALCRTWRASLMVTPTDQTWSDRISPAAAQTQLSLPL
ncbi:putative SOS response-associated peptidase YedK [Novosphingobium sp. PhB57]|uniref:SOS response-associated peptidase n=1 Tax=Novosphingobium sp. PhB57 TaxID=2485107 RepID=UPI0010E39722|nr:SOS response-associated peptidase family protein [Novosphingobium sp. PhB57]TCU51415.1 putative SOS response-associated peptidase YedK [Novosphingobium sp. PhB57]